MNVVIIGAPRSGTNMLRDLLCKFDGFATWPCDEINYIWRYGLRDREDDEFTKTDVTEEKKRFIKKKFDWVRAKYGVQNVVEKTCANSLRVEYVDELLEDARYVFIFRDPMDVVSSAEIRWKAALDIEYILKKARFVPLSDIPYYAAGYCRNRINRYLNKERKLRYWGPKYKGFQYDAQTLTALEISAIQWVKCVTAAERAFSAMDKSRYVAIEYNEFVNDPREQLKRILDFLGCSGMDARLEEGTTEVSSRSVGKGNHRLSKDEIERLREIVGNTYNHIRKVFLGGGDDENI